MIFAPDLLCIQYNLETVSLGFPIPNKRLVGRSRRGRSNWLRRWSFFSCDNTFQLFQGMASAPPPCPCLGSTVSSCLTKCRHRKSSLTSVWYIKVWIHSATEQRLSLLAKLLHGVSVKTLQLWHAVVSTSTGNFRQFLVNSISTFFRNDMIMQISWLFHFFTYFLFAFKQQRRKWRKAHRVFLSSPYYRTELCRVVVLKSVEFIKCSNWCPLSPFHMHITAFFLHWSTVYRGKLVTLRDLSVAAI